MRGHGSIPILNCLASGKSISLRAGHLVSVEVRKNGEGNRQKGGKGNSQEPEAWKKEIETKKRRRREMGLLGMPGLMTHVKGEGRDLGQGHQAIERGGGGERPAKMPVRKG